MYYDIPNDAVQIVCQILSGTDHLDKILDAFQTRMHMLEAKEEYNKAVEEAEKARSKWCGKNGEIAQQCDHPATEVIRPNELGISWHRCLCCGTEISQRL
jgi:hypothetical protein